MKNLLFIMSAVLGLVYAVSGASLNVGPGYYSTISNALVAASDGDTITLLDATHTECGVVITKSVTIQGLGVTNTTVQGATTRSNAANRIFRMNASTKAVIIKDMTIQYGFCSNSVSYGIGGAAIFNNAGTVTVQNCTITMNDSLLTHDTYVYGGGALAQNSDPNCAFILSNSLISSNAVWGTLRPPNGGGIWVGHGALRIEGCTFVANTAPNHGGAIHGQSMSFLTIRNSTLVANSAGAKGGALYFPGISGSSGTVYNCTIYSNVAQYGQGINTVAGLQVFSTILAGSSSALFDGGANIMFSNCLINGSGVGVYTGGNNVTNQDPQLMGLAYNGGPVPTLALQAGSPCANAGSNVLGLSYDQRGAGYVRLRGAATDIGAFEFGAGLLSYSRSGFTEKMPQDTGSIDNALPLLVTLTGDTFTGTDGSEISNTVVVSNLPAGLNVSMVRTNGGAGARVCLFGNATQHAASNTLHNLGFAFQDGAFSLGYASQVGNYNSTNLSVTFLDLVTNATLTFSFSNFVENATYNDGRIDGTTPLLLTLSGDTFTGTDGAEITNTVVVSHLPAGLTVSMIRTNSGSNVVVRLLGQATPHASVNAINNLGFAFQDAAFQGGNAAVVTGASRADLGITLLDPATGVAILYNGSAFREDAAYNDGRVAVAPIGLTLTNDLLNGADGDDFVTAGRVQVFNLPAGLTALVTRVDFQHMNLVLTGRALAHNSANNVSDLTISFQDSAFYNTAAAAVSNATKSDLSISFSNPTLTYGGTNFLEYWQNDGSIGNTLTLTLAGDTFTGLNGDNFVVGVKALCGNVPGGLAASVVRQSITQLVFQLTGSATVHTPADTIANLSLALQDSAFSQGSAAAVTNSARSSLGVQYIGSTGPSNFWVSSSVGSDTTGNGSLASPWATIKFAISQGAVRSNTCDTINVLSGTYNETNIMVNKSVIIKGAGRDTTLVQAGAQFATAPFDSRLFTLSANCVLADMTLRHGNVTNQAQGAAVNSTATEVIMERCRITRNNCYGVYAYNGGAVANMVGLLTMRDCDVTDNTAQIGGVAGVLSWTGASLSVSNCLFSGNQSMHQGGGLYANSALVTLRDSTFRSNSVTLPSAHGGGFSSELPSGTTVVERCTVIANLSPNAGGGMYLRGSSLTLAHCTVFGNVAATNGGGIFVYDGIPRFYNCTIASNRVMAASGTGGGLFDSYGSNMLYSTIIAANSASGTGSDLAGGPTLDNYCLIGNNANTTVPAGLPNANGSYVGTALVPVDPKLLPPADNKGLTWTCELLRGSPAIDHGANPLGVTADQRGGGFTRLVGAAVDIGAYEYRPLLGVMILIE